MLTQVADNQAGTFTGTYDANGNLTNQTLRDGIYTNQDYDELDRPIGIEYVSNDSCADSSCTLYFDNVAYNAFGQRRWDDSAFTDADYTYDKAGRLTNAYTTPAGSGCVLNTYKFDADTNRTSLTRYNPAANGSCQGDTAASTRTNTYDAADRITTAGYTYDALGRTLTVPSADTGNNAGATTITYAANDLVASITQNARTTTYTLDASNQRIRLWTDNVTGSAVTHTNHYSGDSDNPAWTQESPTRYTRPVAGVGGLAGIYDSTAGTTDYQVANLHGDIVATIHGPATGLSSTAPQMSEL